jgi:Ser/Thr protein kinase RdoA (MazF antagonist)
MLAGYQEITPLDPAELEALRGLVAMRIAQRILMAERLSAARPENAPYLRRNVRSSYGQLTNLYA